MTQGRGARVYQGQDKPDNHDETVKRNELVLNYTPLVKRIALHLKNRMPDSVNLEDLIQAGMVGLIDAANNYKNSQGAAFATYASIRIRGAILDDLRSTDWLPRSAHTNNRRLREAYFRLSQRFGRRPTDKEMIEDLNVTSDEYHRMVLDQSIGQITAIEDLGVPEEVISDKPFSESASYAPEDHYYEGIFIEQFKKALAHAIATLPDRDRLVVTLYYLKQMNLREIGQIINVSESRTCQIIAMAMSQLRDKMLEWAGIKQETPFDEPPSKRYRHRSRHQAQQEEKTPRPRKLQDALVEGALPVKKRKKGSESSLLFDEHGEISMRTRHGETIAALQEQGAKKDTSYANSAAYRHKADGSVTVQEVRNKGVGSASAMAYVPPSLNRLEDVAAARKSQQKEEQQREAMESAAAFAAEMFAAADRAADGVAENEADAVDAIVSKSAQTKKASAATTKLRSVSSS